MPAKTQSTLRLKTVPLGSMGVVGVGRLVVPVVASLLVEDFEGGPGSPTIPGNWSGDILYSPAASDEAYDGDWAGALQVNQSPPGNIFPHSAELVWTAPQDLSGFGRLDYWLRVEFPQLSLGAQTYDLVFSFVDNAGRVAEFVEAAFIDNRVGNGQPDTMLWRNIQRRLATPDTDNGVDWSIIRRFRLEARHPSGVAHTVRFYWDAIQLFQGEQIVPRVSRLSTITQRGVRIP